MSDIYIYVYIYIYIYILNYYNMTYNCIQTYTCVYVGMYA